MGRADAGDTAPTARAAPVRARPWVFVAWCVWLLAWLTPALLVGPETADPRPWLDREAAPAAVLAGAALFLVAAWPFWPALELPKSSRDPTGQAGRAAQGDPRGPGGLRSSARGGSVARLAGLSAAEVLVLAALAAPLLVAAWSLGGSLHVWPAAATAAGLAVLGIGLRLAATGLGGGAACRLMFGALLLCGGPPAIYYAAAETVGPAPAWLLEASPVVGLVRAGTVGWPEEAWPQIARLWLWPLLGVGLGVVGAIHGRRAGASQA